MRDGIVGEAAQIAARRMREVLRSLAHLPAVIDADDRQRAARMGQVDLKYFLKALCERSNDFAG